MLLCNILHNVLIQTVNYFRMRFGLMAKLFPISPAHRTALHKNVDKTVTDKNENQNI